MVTKEPPVEMERGLTLVQRRAFMKLPLAERCRQLAKQAEIMVEHYESDAREREQWQGGDIVES
jgi:hypothetical protein